MIVGLLGLQGAFLDHRRHLSALGVESRLVKSVEHLEGIDRLILPGGESTVMAKFLQDFGMRDALRQRIVDGMPVWGICAGAILLARQVDGGPGVLGVLDVSVRRNAYGRQAASTMAAIDIAAMGVTGFQAIFIRAPRITATASTVAVEARWGPDPVFVHQQTVMATTFHPELTPESMFHAFFLRL